MPRDLKEPEGWRFSSLRKILLLRFRNALECGSRGGGVPYHPAALDRAVDSMRGVSLHGLLVEAIGL